MAKRGEVTKEKILKASLDLFVKQGIDRTTTAEITKKVGVAEGTLFVHFKTKQELIDAIYLRIKSEQANLFSEKNIDIDDPRSTIMGMVETMCMYFLKRKKEFYFMEMIHNTDHVSQSAMRSGMKRFVSMMKKMQEWQDRGVIKKGECEFFGFIIWNMCRAIIEYSIMKKQKTLPEGVTEIVWDAIKK